MRNKILFISHWYPSKQNPNTGIFVQKHADAIAELNEIDVVHFNFLYSKKVLKIVLENKNENNVNIYRITVESRFYKILFYLLPLHFILFRRLSRKFKINLVEYKLVHSNVLFPNGILGYLISKKYHLPQVHTEHWSKLTNFFSRNIYRRKGKKTLEEARFILPVSHFLANEINKYCTNPNITIIPNVVDSSYFVYRDKIKKDKMHFLAVAQWEKPKNPFLFLEALEKINKQNLFPFELTMIGGGAQIEEIKKRNYNFKINFLGYKPTNELAQYFYEADFLLHGSDYETFSVVIIEALYSGTPVIVSNVGIVNEVINQSNGFICSNNIENWCENLVKAVKLNYNHKKISNDIYGKYDASKISLEISKIYSYIK